jgi:hypothetical protein
LREKLRACDIDATIIDVLAGMDIEGEIIFHLTTCRLVVIFGTEDYGAEGTVKYSTREELGFIRDQNIPFFLIKMCSQFKDPKTVFRLQSNVAHYPHEVGVPIPDELVEHIARRYYGMVRTR